MAANKNYLKIALKYLIEIVIIIIGILGAFALDSWGNQNKRLQTEREIIRQIFIELDDNLSDLENDYAVHRVAMNSHIRITQFLDGREINRDSLSADFYWATKDEYIFPNTSGYENLKSIGVDIIQNDTLRNLVSLIYSNNFPRLTKGKTLFPDIRNFLSPYYEQHFQLNRDTTPYQIAFQDGDTSNFPLSITPNLTLYARYQPKNWPALRQDERFRFLLANVLEFRLYKLAMYRRAVNNVKRALDMMERDYPEALLD